MLEVTKNIPELNIDEGDSVLVFKEDGFLGLALPKTFFDEPDRPAPAHVAVAAAIAALFASRNEELAALIDKTLNEMVRVIEFLVKNEEEEYLQ